MISNVIGSSVQCGPLTPTKREQVGAADRHRRDARHRVAVDELDVDRRAEHEGQRAAGDEHAEHVDLREPDGGADEEAVVEEVLGDRDVLAGDRVDLDAPGLDAEGLAAAPSGSPSAAAVMSSAVQPLSSAYCSQSITGSSGNADTVGVEMLTSNDTPLSTAVRPSSSRPTSPASSMLARSV